MPASSVVSTFKRRDARTVLNEQASPELIFAVVGPVGSGTTWVAEALATLSKASIEGAEIKIIKASTVIENAAKQNGNEIAAEAARLTRATFLQDAGDNLRKEDTAAVGSLLVSAIKAARIEWDDSDAAAGVTQLHAGEGIPKKAQRIYVLDSLKHPAEVKLLRAVYREAFCLIGVVCDTTTRKKRLQDGKCSDSSSAQIDVFMRRDEDASDKWGQHVSDTFHLADFFVDNTPDRYVDQAKKIENKEWVVSEKLGRLLDILIGEKIVRPTPSEIGMFHATGAQMRSACLSRQVGAALTDNKGNLISTGTNEVPRFGGGVYGGQLGLEVETESIDHRCAITNKYCSNTRVQDEMITEVINAIPALRNIPDQKKIREELKKTALGRLLEFSRAVHAEMDALLSAARAGAPTVGTKLFVTTFPCHYCARHVVSAGVEEVQYIEPYPKSRAFELHSDAIEQTFTKWLANPQAKPTKVLFRPFTGVAPKLYARAFMKHRKLKNELGELHVAPPEWATGLLEKSYRQLETSLEEGPDNDKK
ncbi:anti-phage dCTP deaminase [Variovorax sp. EBFNA2]|uniref:anti-phage dCTP deaminase n=1 Tax=Variovorax sp. EBFNA2 TaxID=3342097 RepID=UPI0029C07409|nr:anti-phage dCTP deaminase [Variovorax boronicumulans]WPG36934.1 anti-phage dCTP deaminase [Variovorax boronicumulans]